MRNEFSGEKKFQKICSADQKFRVPGISDFMEIFWVHFIDFYRFWRRRPMRNERFFGIFMISGPKCQKLGVRKICARGEKFWKIFFGGFKKVINFIYPQKWVFFGCTIWNTHFLHPLRKYYHFFHLKINITKDNM